MKKNSKLQKIAFMFLAVFIATASSTWGVTVYSASTLPVEPVEYVQQNEVSQEELRQMVNEASLVDAAEGGKQQRFVCGGACLYALGFFSSYLLGKLVDFGNKKFCGRYKNSYWFTKSYCGFMGY